VLDYLVLNVVEKGCENDEVFARPQLPTISHTINSRFEEDLGDDSKLVDQYLGDNHESTRLSQANNLPVMKKSSLNDLTVTGNFFQVNLFFIMLEI